MLKMFIYFLIPLLVCGCLPNPSMTSTLTKNNGSKNTNNNFIGNLPSSPPTQSPSPSQNSPSYKESYFHFDSNQITDEFNNSSGVLTSHCGSSPVAQTGSNLKGGGALYFYGGSFDLNLNSLGLSASVTSDFTIEFLVSADGAQTPFSSFLCSGATAYLGLCLNADSIHNESFLAWVNWTNGSSPNLVSNIKLIDDTWHLVVIEQKNHIIYFYVDGVMQTIASPFAFVDFGNGVITVGKGGAPYTEACDNYFKGWIDELHIIKGKAVY